MIDSAASHVAHVLSLGSPAEVLRWHRDQPFDWRRSNCCVLVADYHLSRTGVDVISPWRWAYADTEAAAFDVVMSRGGMEAFWKGLGAVAVADPQDGDVAIAAHEAGVWHSGGVWIRRRGEVVIASGSEFHMTARL